VTEDRDNLPELPTGWVWAKTGDICEGIVPGRTKPKNFNGTIPWITLPDVTGLYISKSQNNLAVTREDAEEVGMRVMPKGTVLMSCVGQFGIICIAEDELVPNQQFHGFLCLDKIFSEYIAYSLMTQVDQMEQLSSATTIAYINKTKCNSIQIPLAPLNEQRRIVAKIEALKARSQRVKEELEAIAPLLDQFRQSVLAAAFRGDLTADWREKNPDISPVKQLLSKREKNDTSNLPSTWCLVLIEDVIHSLKYGTSKKCDYEVEGTPVLRIPNIDNGIIDQSDLKYADLCEKELEGLRLAPGDILVVRSNGSVSLVGKSALIGESEKDFAYAGYLIRLRPNKFLIDSKYLNLCLASHDLRLQIEVPARSTSGVHNINSQEVKQLQIALPPIEEQQEIVRRIEIFFKTADQVKQQYQEAQAYLNKLNHSILAKAFRGELVPQDPNDEPASVLLERIRAEREKLDTKKKAKGKTEKKSRKAKPEAAEPKQLSLPGFD
jgi:type I restriction enzyme S subunit